MGGYGSGRDEYATTSTVEECRSIDVNRLSDVLAAAHYRGRIWWGDRDDPVARVTITTDATTDLGDGDVRASRIRLAYRLLPPVPADVSVDLDAVDDDAGEPFDYPIGVDWTECNFGGYRPWFRCPGVRDGVECGRRVGKLYRPPRADYYLCRHCYGLGYSSSRASGNEMETADLRYRRAFAKADADGRRPHPNCAPYVPDRPAGMHFDTFADLLEDVREARREYNDAADRKTRHLISALDA